MAKIAQITKIATITKIAKIAKTTKTAKIANSGAASPKILGGGKMFDFRRIALFCLEKRLSRHKMTIYHVHVFSHKYDMCVPLGHFYWRGKFVCRRY